MVYGEQYHNLAIAPLTKCDRVLIRASYKHFKKRTNNKNLQYRVYLRDLILNEVNKELKDEEV